MTKRRPFKKMPKWRFAGARGSAAWRRFRDIPADDGPWLAWLRSGQCVLGKFYCDVFVQDGYRYNETPGMITHIAYIQKVVPPNAPSSDTREQKI